MARARNTKAAQTIGFFIKYSLIIVFSAKNLQAAELSYTIAHAGISDNRFNPSPGGSCFSRYVINGGEKSGA
jgi:hypothetical protein